LDVIRLFKKWETVEFYTETCPHYLTLTEEMMGLKGSLAKMSPPLRKQEDVDEMWNALGEDLIDVVASDHAGYKIQDKGAQWEQIFRSPNGIPGLETLTPLLYHRGVARGRITWPTLTKTLAFNPARIFGLYPRKGSLVPGADADIVIFNPHTLHLIGKKNQYLKTDYTLYEDWEIQGAPESVLLRGEVVYENGEIKAEAGGAEFIAARRVDGNRL
jgi:dihydropyrimidinase